MFLFNIFKEFKFNDHITITSNGCDKPRNTADNYSVDKPVNFYLNRHVFIHSL